MCQLMHPDSRGTLTPTADGAPRISYGYLRTEYDRRRLRHAIRTAADLLRAGLGARVEPDGHVLGSDRALDGWIAAHLTTAQHLCGTAAMGPGVSSIRAARARARAPADRRSLRAAGRAPRGTRPPRSRSGRRERSSWVSSSRTRQDERHDGRGRRAAAEVRRRGRLCRPAALRRPPARPRRVHRGGAGPVGPRADLRRADP